MSEKEYNYEFVPFNGSRLHIEAATKLMSEQADAHGLHFNSKNAKSLSEILITGNKCHGIMCVNKTPLSPTYNKIIAMVTYYNGISQDGKIYHLEDIVVLEDMRRNGIGTKCLGAFLLLAQNDGKNGVRFHIKSGSAAETRLFKHFGNFAVESAPPILNIPIPKAPSPLPDEVELLSKTNANNAFDFLRSQLDWRDIATFIEIAKKEIHGVEGLVKIKNSQINGIVILSQSFDTINVLKNTHVNVFASKDPESDLPVFIKAIQSRQMHYGRMGNALIDFKDCHKTDWPLLSRIAKECGAKEWQYVNAAVISGSFGREAFDNALRIAKMEKENNLSAECASENRKQPDRSSTQNPKATNSMRNDEPPL